ncbi:MAG TPA: BACON domain-containing protein [Bacteroidales bacterium]|nr:BACON domain-containing protein [Bacteroidales bacterium]
MNLSCLKNHTVLLIALLSVLITGCGRDAKSSFPDFPPDDVTNLMDRDQMLAQLGIELPVLPPKMNDPNAPGGAFPVNPDNPEGNWTDSGKVNTIQRSPFGLWNNYSDRASGFYPGPDSVRLGDYKIIDLLILNNGEKISTPEEWWEKRRREIKKDLENELYGKIPHEKMLPKVTWEVTSFRGGKGNAAYIQKQITGNIDISGYPEVRDKPVIKASLRTPASVSEPFPVIIYFGGFGNAMDMYWERSLPHGWGVCVFDLTKLQPDNGVGLTSYLIGLVSKGNWRKPDDWGTLVAWSWGVSRIIDYLETDKNVDANKLGLSGVSRYGKATIVTMAYEPRLAIAFPGDAGSLGTKLNRRHWGQDLESSTPENEYHWMAGNFFKWAGEKVPGQYLPRKIEDLPVDAHSLLALCAPRPVFMDGGTTSTWCDPYGVYLTGKYATPVYELLGVDGLIMNDPKPIVDKGYTDGRIGYRIHDGGHTDSPDWPAFFEFASKNLDITTLSLSASNLVLPQRSGNASFTVKSNREWKAECQSDWLKIEPLSANGSDTVTITALANGENKGRQSVITIKTEGREQKITINQEALKPLLEIVGREIKIGAAENSIASLEIKSNTAWTIAVSNVPDPETRPVFMMGSGNWLVPDKDAGVNSAVLRLTASANPGVRKRMAILTVSAAGAKPSNIFVTQEEGSPTLEIMTEPVFFAAEGGNASPIFVQTNSLWSAVCSSGWFTATPSSGGNFSQLTINAEENTTGAERHGEVIVSVPGLEPKKIIVRQGITK